MSIHAAKGLEYPAVILADTNHGPGRAYPMLLVTPEGRVGVRMKDEEGGGPQRLFDLEALEDEDKAADDAEERRVHYVALTRAMRRLVIMGRAKWTTRRAQMRARAGAADGAARPASRRRLDQPADRRRRLARPQCGRRARRPARSSSAGADRADHRRRGS